MQDLSQIFVQSVFAQSVFVQNRRPRSLPKVERMERLRRRTDFRAAATGVRAPASAFVLQARPRGDERVARIGFTVSKQVGNAVERNRVRRRLREIVRLAPASTLRDGNDYVLVGRRAALAAPFDEMRQELDTALTRVHAVQAPRRGTGSGRERSLHEAGPDRPRRQKHPQERHKQQRKDD
jgi:ribonuclease P protein component